MSMFLGLPTHCRGEASNRMLSVQVVESAKSLYATPHTGPAGQAKGSVLAPQQSITSGYRYYMIFRLYQGDDNGSNLPRREVGAPFLQAARTIKKRPLGFLAGAPLAPDGSACTGRPDCMLGVRCDNLPAVLNGGARL